MVPCICDGVRLTAEILERRETNVAEIVLVDALTTENRKIAMTAANGRGGEGEVSQIWLCSSTSSSIGAVHCKIVISPFLRSLRSRMYTLTLGPKGANRCQGIHGSGQCFHENASASLARCCHKHDHILTLTCGLRISISIWTDLRNEERIDINSGNCIGL